jgi:hypothetical protein
MVMNAIYSSSDYWLEISRSTVNFGQLLFFYLIHTKESDPSAHENCPLFERCCTL